MSFNFPCNLDWILQDVPHQLWEAQTADGLANPLLTRFLHNKPLFYANNLLRCYLLPLSPEAISATFTILGLILFLIGLWSVVARKQYKLLAFLLIAPLFPLFQLPKNPLFAGLILYSSQVLIMLSWVLKFY